MHLTFILACILVTPALVPIDDAEARRSFPLRAWGGRCLAQPQPHFGIAKGGRVIVLMQLESRFFTSPVLMNC